MMFVKANKTMSTDLVKVSILNGIATVIRMLTAFVSVKVVAALIGPAGVALLGQLNNFSQIILSISNGGINSGITKYTSEFSDSEKDYVLYLGTGFWITIILSVITSLVLFIWAAYFSETFLHDIRFKSVFYIFGGTVFLYALNGLLVSVINGFKEYKKYVIVNIIGSVVGVIFAITLSLRFGIYGALVSLVTYQSIVFFITITIVAKSYWFKWASFFSKFNKQVAIKLGHYSLMAIVSAVTVPAGQMIVRTFIINGYGKTDAGLWEGINRISSMYLMVITTSLSVYFLPKLAELKTKKELRLEIFSVYKLAIPFLLLSTFIIYIFRMLIIRILFTHEFARMENLFAWQLIGDILKIMGWVLGYLLLAKAMTKTYIVTELINFLLLIIISYFLVNVYGTLGATIAFAIVYLVYFIVLCFVLRNFLTAGSND